MVRDRRGVCFAMRWHTLLACKNEPRLIINNITNVYRYNVYTHIVLHTKKKKKLHYYSNAYTMDENAQAPLFTRRVCRSTKPFFFFPPLRFEIPISFGRIIITTTIRMYMSSLYYRNGAQLLFSTQIIMAYNKRNTFMHVNKSSHFGRVNGFFTVV